MDQYIPTGTAFMASASSEFLFPFMKKKREVIDLKLTHFLEL